MKGSPFSLFRISWFQIMQNWEAAKRQYYLEELTDEKTLWGRAVTTFTDKGSGLWSLGMNARRFVSIDWWDLEPVRWRCNINDYRTTSFLTPVLGLPLLTSQSSLLSLLPILNSLKLGCFLGSALSPLLFSQWIIAFLSFIGSYNSLRIWWPSTPENCPYIHHQFI